MLHEDEHSRAASVHISWSYIQASICVRSQSISCADPVDSSQEWSRPDTGAQMLCTIPCYKTCCEHGWTRGQKFLKGASRRSAVQFLVERVWGTREFAAHLNLTCACTSANDHPRARDAATGSLISYDWNDACVHSWHSSRSSYVTYPCICISHFRHIFTMGHDE